MDRLKHHCDTRSGFILVDVAGVCQKTTIQAATVADLTITPSKLSAPDVKRSGVEPFDRATTALR